MPDVRNQLRAYFDEVDPPFNVADLTREPRPELAPTRRPVRHGLLIAAAAAVVVLLVVGLPLLLSDGQPDPAVEPPVTTVQPATTLDTAPTVPIVPEYVTGLLSCLPLDPAGWSRSEPLPAMAAAPVVSDAALTAAGGTAVAVGMDMNRNVEAYWSHDGVEWVPTEGFPEATVVGESPPAVAGGPAGFVAVVVPDIYPGLAPADHPDTPPIVAFSEDGITWDVLDPESLPHGVLWLSDVYAGPAGFLISGAVTTDLTDVGRSEDETGAFVWASPDGRSWSVADYPVDSWPYPAVIATDTGWAVNTTEIWRSTDGVHWYEAPTENAPWETVVVADFRASPTCIHDDTWVIVSSLDRSGTPTAWVSTDDGATWDEYPIDDQPAREHESWDLAATRLGLLLTGRHDWGVEHASLLHYSTEGTHWQTCATPRLDDGAAAHFTEIAMLGDTLIILDSETGIFHTWNDPNAPNTNVPIEGGRP